MWTVTIGRKSSRKRALLLHLNGLIEYRLEELRSLPHGEAALFRLAYLGLISLAIR